MSDGPHRRRSPGTTVLIATFLILAGLIAGFGGFVGLPLTEPLREVAIGVCAGFAIVEGVITLIREDG